MINAALDFKGNTLSTDEKAYLKRFLISDFKRYANDPLGYATHVLKERYWGKQIEIMEAVRTHQKVMIESGNMTGKSRIGGGLVNWWYDAHNPGICLTTAPTEVQVVDILWKEVRVLRQGRPGLQPKAPRMESSPDHFAHGFTTRDVSSFQGRHSAHVMILFDESTGVSNEFWEAARSMINSPEDRWVCFLNPLDTSSYAYQESQTGNWHVINVSCLDHPNISAELRGELPPIPSAVRLAFVEDAVRSWSEPVTDTILATDLEWPPRSGKYIRPSPIFEARILGMWPSQSVFSLWSKSLIKTCEERRFELPTVEDKVAPEIGCDPARFGDDHSSIFVRWGKSVVVRETYKGCDTTFVAGRLKVLCNEWGVRAGVPVRLVPCKIDVVGLGAGVVDQAGRGDEKYNFIPVNSASSPVRENRYVKRRDELWETTVELAKRGLIEWSRLDKKAKDELSRQLLAPRYEYDGSGRMRVDQKDDVKKRIGRSPDDADALNLCVTSTLYRPERKKQDEGMPKVRYPHFYQTAYAMEKEGAWKTGHW